MNNRNCYSCRYRINVTEVEKQLLIPKLKSAGINSEFSFVCRGKWSKSPYLIQRYLSSPVRDCDYFAPGFFSEILPTKCPTCKSGQVRISRPVKDKTPYILFGCSSYPDCRTTFQKITLETNCRFCDVPLLLSGHNLMMVSCPKCKRSTPAPLLFETWPYLLKNAQQCPHGKTFEGCDMCRQSIQRRINLLDLELPGVSALWNGERPKHPDIEQTSRPSRTDDDYFDSDEYFYGVNALREAQREAEQEEEEEYFDNRREYWEGLERMNDEGWFYPE